MFSRQIKQAASALALSIAVFGASSCQDGDPELANQYCGYQYHEITKECLEARFLPNVPYSEIVAYLEAANYTFVGREQSNERNYSVWYREDDYEKGPRETLIIATIQNDRISSLTFSRWASDNWRSDGQRRSPFSNCVEDLVKCGVLIDG